MTYSNHFFCNSVLSAASTVGERSANSSIISSIFGRLFDPSFSRHSRNNAAFSSSLLLLSADGGDDERPNKLPIDFDAKSKAASFIENPETVVRRTYKQTTANSLIVALIVSSGLCPCVINVALMVSCSLHHVINPTFLSTSGLSGSARGTFATFALAFLSIGLMLTIPSAPLLAPFPCSTP